MEKKLTALFFLFIYKIDRFHERDKNIKVVYARRKSKKKKIISQSELVGLFCKIAVALSCIRTDTNKCIIIILRIYIVVI